MRLRLTPPALPGPLTGPIAGPLTAHVPPAATGGTLCLPLQAAGPARAIEQAWLGAGPPGWLMERAGRSVASLARALAPHARRVLILAGPGNNGGDGAIAARELAAVLGAGAVELIPWGDPARQPADAARAWQQARQAGVPISASPGSSTTTDAAGAHATFAFDHAWARLGPQDLIIDALLGRGLTRPVQGPLAGFIQQVNLRRGSAPGPRVLAVDLPSGLPGDCGCWPPAGADPAADSPVILRADWTLALLSPAPGLWMGQGRDHAGEIWFDDLGWSEGQSAVPPPPSAWLHLQPAALGLPRPHAGHKGRFGSVRVVGGAPGMSGAAVLAARAALQAGAGKVHLHDLSADTGVGGRVARGSDLATAPELMASAWSPSLSQDAALSRSSTVVAGCGGGQAIALALPGLIDHATRLVLDADALNVLAAETGLRAAVQQRGRRGLATVLTPHPLEAARLLGRSTAEVQADRLACAQTLAEGLQAAVILKGSGSVLALPDGDAPWINPTGHAALATAGSGDVLAGWLGGLWSQLEPQADDPSTGELRRCCALAMWTHGRAAELASPQGQALPAGQLVEALGSFLRQGRW